MSWSVTSASVNRTAPALTRSTSAPLAEESSVTRSDSFERSGQTPPADATTADATTADATTVEPSNPDATNSDDAAERKEMPVSSQGLSADEQHMITELQSRDREVRAHEAAHQAAGGGAVGGASYSYQQGPDGRQYAVGGEVPVDLSTSGSSPEAIIAKMARVRAAALAPADPSAQDFAVAAAAAAIEASVRQAQRVQSVDDQSTRADKSGDKRGDKQDAGAATAALGATSDVAGAIGAPGVEREAAIALLGSSSGKPSATAVASSTVAPLAIMGAPSSASASASSSSDRTMQRALGAYRAATAPAVVSGIDQRA